MNEQELTQTMDAAAFEACTALSQVLDAHVALSRIRKTLEPALAAPIANAELGARLVRLNATLDRVHGLLTRAAAFMPEDVWMDFVSQSRPAVEADVDVWGDAPHPALMAVGG